MAPRQPEGPVHRGCHTGQGNVDRVRGWTIMQILAETHPELLAARLQMAFTLGTHIILACLGVGLPVLLILAEGLSLRGDRVWRELARRWSRAFAVLFAVGAVSGTVLSFELGLLWPEFMGRWGSVIGLPFTLEGFAFFVEAIFAGIYLYGWDRLPARVHWLTAFPIAGAGFASAWFVVTANAWMNSPTGFDIVDGQLVNIDPVAAMLNPATGAQTTHMILAAYMVTGFLLASFYALQMLRGQRTPLVRRALLASLALGCLATPFQMVSGDWCAKVVARTQPVKFAAMEATFETTQRAPLHIGGIPDPKTGTVAFSLEIPGLLSFLASGDSRSTVVGLNDFPREDWPPVTIVHVAFQIMVGLGLFLLAVSIWTGVRAIRKTAPDAGRGYLPLVFLSGPAAVIAMESGWVVTEVGRQPWIVQGLMRTREAVTGAEGLWWILAFTILIYAVLLAGLWISLRLLAGLPGESGGA